MYVCMYVLESWNDDSPALSVVKVQYNSFEIPLSCVDIITLFVDNSPLPAVIVLAVIAVVAIIAGVILLILYIKLRTANKRLYLSSFFPTS